MRFDLAGPDAERAYALLSSLIIPRPIAWVGTIDAQGRHNAAPFSFFNLFGDDPPVVAIGPSNREDGTPKDTALNLKETGVFTVNLVDADLLDRMHQTAVDLPRGESEFVRAGLTPIPGEAVAAPRIAESPVQMECVVERIVEIGSSRIVLGRVVRVHVREGLIDPVTLRPRPGQYRPLARMDGPDGYLCAEGGFTASRPAE